MKLRLRFCLSLDKNKQPSPKSVQTVNAGQGVEKREPSYTVGGNVNWYSHCGGQCGRFLKKLKTELPYNPAIPLLGMYLEKNSLKGYRHPNVHCSTVYNSQDMEAT